MGCYYRRQFRSLRSHTRSTLLLCRSEVLLGSPLCRVCSESDMEDRVDEAVGRLISDLSTGDYTSVTVTLPLTTLGPMPSQ